MPFAALWSRWRHASGRRATCRPSFRPTLQCLEQRALCSLTPVTNTTQFPYSAVLHVDAVFDTNHNGRIDNQDGGLEGTAVMIGPSTALTDAHVVFDPELGGLAGQVIVTPGQNGHVAPFGSDPASAWVIPAQYPSTFTPGLFLANAGSDLAVLQLPPVRQNGRDVPLGMETGWLGHAAYTDRSLIGLKVTNIGYPAQTLSGINQYRSHGPLVNAFFLDGVGGLIFDNRSITTQKGSSGSPFIRATPQGPIVVALDGRALSPPLKFAVRITNRMNDFIQQTEQLPVSGGQVLNFNFGARSHTPGFVPASDA